MPTYQHIEDKYLVPLYAKRERVLVRGQGVWLFDNEGNKYLDMMSNYGPNILGHGHRVYSRDVQKQIPILISCHQSFYNDKRAQLIEAYSKLLPKNLRRFFFSNSGTESVEAALKFARAVSGKKIFIATTHSYHGRTFGSLAATGASKYQDPYKPLMQGFKHVEFCNSNALETMFKKNAGNIAGFIIEPIQGEGGINVPEVAYIKKIRQRCTKYGVSLISDEVQTAFRTGKLFAFEHFGVVPDILCTSKGIANGVPMGLTITSSEVADKVPKGTHGNTFGGGPLACAAALSTITIFTKTKLDKHVERVGAYFSKGLKAIQSPLIREVRGKGLMIAVELRDRVTPYLKAMQQEGVIALPAGATTIRFLPPLIITEKDWDKALKVIGKVLQEK